MLRTKKNSLDINRRAVSKRIKGIQNDGACVKTDPHSPDREQQEQAHATDTGGGWQQEQPTPPG